MQCPCYTSKVNGTGLATLHWSSCLVYLDDIIVYSRSEEHLTLFGEAFARLRKAGLKIKPSRCHLLQTSVCYLGHVVSEIGVRDRPGKNLMHCRLAYSI